MGNGQYRDTETGKYYGSLAEYTAAKNATQQSGIQTAFQQAVNELKGSQGAAEKAYQTGKNKTLAQTAMSNLNAGMANTTNMAAASNAYDQANRSSFDAAIGGQSANLYSNYANTLAGLYNTNLNYQVAGDQIATQNAGNASSSKVNSLSSQVQTLQNYINQLGNSSNTSSGGTSPSWKA
jgi:hypothetical protein